MTPRSLMIPLLTRRAPAVLLAGLALLALFGSPARADGTWRTTASLTVARADHTATLLEDGRVLVAGGRTQGSTPIASAELYDPSMERWTSVGSMEFARYEHTATLLEDGRVLVVGGAPETPAELYDPRTRTWRRTTDALDAPRSGHTATLLRDGRVLVAGGDSTVGGGVRLDSAEIYNPATGSWTAARPLADARSGHVAAPLSGGRVLVAGGLGNDETLASAEAYDPATGRWRAAGSLAVPRREATATLLPDGRPLVAGGFDSFSFPRRSAEIYDPSARRGPWIAAPSMSTARGLHTATALPNGTTLVTGNAPGEPEVSSSELYHPAFGRWEVAPPLTSGRGRHTGTLLAGSRCGPICGRVLVVGGRRGITADASAELYRPPPVPRSALRVTDLRARAISPTRVSLRFSAPASPRRDGAPATAYVVKQARRRVTKRRFARARTLCGGVCRFSPAQVGESITLTVTRLAAGRVYHYALRPVAEGGRRGPLSNRARARTPRDRIGPGRVGGLSAQPLPGAVRLRFRAPASDGRRGPPVRSFEIRQSSRPIRGRREFDRAEPLCRGACRFRPRRVGAMLTLRVTGLCRAGPYHFAIRARDEGRNRGPISRFRAVRVSGRGDCR